MKLIASVSLHLFLTADGPRHRVDVNPLVHVEQREHLRAVAQTLREVATQLEQEATGLVLPQSGLVS